MIGSGKWVGIWGGDYTVKMARFWEWFYTMHHFAPKALTDFCMSLLFSRKTYGFTLLGRRLKRESRDFFFARLLRGSPLPYHTANGKTVTTVIVILRDDICRVRNQVVTTRSRTSSGRPPEAIRDAYVDVAIRVKVVARTEKVEKSPTSWHPSMQN